MQQMNPVKKICEKLRILKKTLKELNSKAYRFISDRVLQKEEQLRELQQVMQFNPFDDALIQGKTGVEGVCWFTKR